jgi:hypothetical protein
VENELLDKKLELLHNLLVPQETHNPLVEELSEYTQAFEDFKVATLGCTDPFDEKYILALRVFRDVLLAKK